MPAGAFSEPKRVYPKFFRTQNLGFLQKNAHQESNLGVAAPMPAGAFSAPKRAYPRFSTPKIGVFFKLRQLREMREITEFRHRGAWELNVIFEATRGGQ